MDAVELVEATEAAGSAGSDSPEPQAEVKNANQTTPATAARITGEFYSIPDHQTRCLGEPCFVLVPGLRLITSEAFRPSNLPKWSCQILLYDPHNLEEPGPTS